MTAPNTEASYIPGAPITIQIQPAAPAAAETPAPSKRPQALLPQGSLRVDVQTLRQLIYEIDEYVYFGTYLSEEKLKAMEMVMAQLRSRYGAVFGSFQ
jgi:hypothetical protein